MPKATLSFNLPEEEEDFNNAVNANKMSAILWDMDQWLRSRIKYVTDGQTDLETQAYVKCRQQLIELTKELPEHA